MASTDSSTLFLREAARRLTQQGWHTIDETPAPFDMTLTREKSTLIVHSRVVLFFADGDALSRREMQEAIEQAHALTSEAATPPLFPATAIVVFMYSDTTPKEMPENKRNIARSHATVAWIANLQTGQLTVHHGVPLIREGKRILEQALHALANDG